MRRNALPVLAIALAAALAGCASPPGPSSSQPARSAGVVAIGAVQGSGPSSPLLGERVVVEGMVTADFHAGLGGWFVQDAGDGDPRTSDALFVRGDGLAPLAAGEYLRLAGTVAESGRDGQPTLTTLHADAVTRVAGPAPAVVDITATPGDWERYEGMQVRITAPLTVSGHHEFARRGVLATSFEGRLFTPTEIARPGDDARAVAADNARRTLLIDDGSDQERPARVAYLGDRPVPRSGSMITFAQGVLDQRWGEYRLQPTAPLQFEPAARPQPPTVAGDLRLAALNLQNLFNGDGRGGGFPTPRGARTPEALAAQLGRVVATLRALDPDIVALMELENDGFDDHSSIAQLVGALNVDGADWRFVDAGQGPGTDAIRVALLYRATKVVPVGAPATLVEGPFGTRSRAPLAQAFRAGRGPAFVVVANHFKSKGCGQAQGADRDQGDGQACWNAQRLDSAQRLMRWLDTDPTGSGSDLVAIVGDLNAYAQEDPVRAFIDAGWRDAFDGVSAPYSFVFDAQAGRLDHALLSPALKARLMGAAKWHSNADEASNVGNPDANVVDQPHQPWRSSDHDPLLIGLRLGAP